MERAVRQLGVHIQRETGERLPPVRVSCGFPSRSVRKVAGQCWAPTSSGDGISQMFISPLIDDPVEVLSTLLHELCHAIIMRRDQEARRKDPNHKLTPGHGAAFKALATAVGLEGKMTATVPSASLTELLRLTSEKLGKYPHAALSLSDLPLKRKTHMLKLQAVGCCGYTARTTNKWIEEGLPSCPHGARMARV